MNEDKGEIAGVTEVLTATTQKRKEKKNRLKRNQRQREQIAGKLEIASRMVRFDLEATSLEFLLNRDLNSLSHLKSADWAEESQRTHPREVFDYLVEQYVRDSSDHACGPI